jgi:hypothetical protein
MPQKMIPPQPIIEDEEKELGALEILEKNLQQIIQMADQGKQIIDRYIRLRSLLDRPLINLPAQSPLELASLATV